MPLPSVMSPMAMPETGRLIFMPASIRACVPPQTEAIDDDPVDSRMSETNANGVDILQRDAAS